MEKRGMDGRKENSKKKRGRRNKTGIEGCRRRNK